MLAVIVISFTLTIDVQNSRLHSQNGYFVMLLFSILLNYEYKYHDHLQNNLQFLISSNSFLFSSTISSLSANTDPLVGVYFVFWKELNKRFFALFLKVFFHDTGFSVRSFVPLVGMNCSLQNVKKVVHVIKILSLNGYLKSK